MRKFASIGVGLVACAAMLGAAWPQDPGPGRVATEFADRCTAWIGKTFDMSVESTTVHLNRDGQYRLVSVGTDYAEFWSDDTTVLIPLARLHLVCAR